jgi:ribosomal protein S18 acetylase RimI-like enzyme
MAASVRRLPRATPAALRHEASLVLGAGSPIEVSIATDATDELARAFARLIPQLSTSVPPDRQALAEIVASPSTTVLVARDRSKRGEIVGTLTLVTFRIPTSLRAWIEDVVVDSAARGRGVAQALSAEAIRIARQRGARHIDLTSRPSRQAARRLYQKLGFALRETGLFRYSVPEAKNS